MTTPSRAAARTGRRPEHLRALSEQLPRFGRLIHALKAQAATDGRDAAALILLFPLVRIVPALMNAGPRLLSHLNPDAPVTRSRLATHRHGKHHATVPLGARATLDADAGTLVVDEVVTSD